MHGFDFNAFVWSPRKVKQTISFDKQRLVVVSNRISDPRRGDQAGGLAVALADALQHSGGVWVGWSGEISEDAAIASPKRWSSQGVDYVTIDLTQSEHDAYYLGHSNACLWPMFHYRTDLMRFDRAHYETYLSVNTRFADALSSVLQPTDMVWVHDYHLIPLAAQLQQRGYTQPVGYFHHIPFPPPQVVKTFPEHARLVSDLFAYDVVGMQTDQDIQSLQAYAVDELGATLHRGGRIEAFNTRVTAQVFPVGIDVDDFARAATTSDAAEIVSTMTRAARDTTLIIGVDRLDYTKGIAERFMAYRRLLEQHSELRRGVSFLQIAATSREDVASYDELGQEIDQIVGKIQGDFADVDWNPVQYVRRSVARDKIAALYRAARVGFVTPLRDGMNLVAKEYVAAQNPDNPGVLVLSQFAGAASEMTDALLVNPYDCDEMADALHTALNMPLSERQTRHAHLLAGLRRNDIAAWRRRFLATLASCHNELPLTSSVINDFNS